ncbi:G-protein beta WD-40 repeats containing protein [Reticulomyxa filosa]|uniref:G-protein beta WD-40 repeats containing protein n=1 Tax=Reticulomyxa filosa TaxID=46433 RepID=X6NXS7_RETFI|nr:G-protein beta WD-40 repeats containing protein [Reticulomyxa filosa]|eukprot:ETO31115.1 G-protein beta WD-40 repeats containing protein [Reticulomyxa filosa]
MKQANKNSNDEVKTEVALLSLEQSCFNKDWILRSHPQEYIKHFICLICNQIANNPMDIECPQHANMDESLIAGEHCLKLFFEKHNNSCPIQSHSNCQYSRSNAVRKYIGDLTVTCIRQFEQELKTLHETEREGETREVIKCNFQGKLKDLNAHLISECPLNLINCWFKPFGCNYTYHLITNMKLHFDLVTQLLQSMKQEIQSKEKQIIEKDNRIKQMERDFKQDLLKYRADIEMTKKDFNDKEKQILSNHQKTIKSLEEKNAKLTQDYKQLLQKLDDKHKEEEKETNKKEIYQQSTLSSSGTAFDLFRSSSKLLNTFIGHTGCVWSIDYSTFDNSQILCSGSDDKTVSIWDLDTNKHIQSFTGHASDVHCVKFSPYHHNYNCNVVCSSSNDNTIRFWDIKQNQQLRLFNGHAQGVNCIGFSTFNGGHKYGIFSVDFSPLQSNNSNSYKSNNIGVIGGNGYTFCSGSFDKTIRLWDIETTKQLIVFRGHKYWVKSVKYGSNESGIIGGSNTILSGSTDKTVRLWDIRTRQQTQIFNGHTSFVWVVDYSPFVIKNNNEIIGGNVICSGGLDNTIRFWDIRANRNELYIMKGDEKVDNGILLF